MKTFALQFALAVVFVTSLSAESLTLIFGPSGPGGSSGTLSLAPFMGAYPSAPAVGSGLSVNAGASSCSGCSGSQTTAFTGLGFPLNFGFTSGAGTNVSPFTFASGGSVSGLSSVAGGLTFGSGGTLSETFIPGGPLELTLYTFTSPIGASSLLGTAGAYQGVLTVSGYALFGPTTGFVSTVYSGSLNLTGSGSVPKTPEPETLVMFGTGLVALGIYRKKQRA